MRPLLGAALPALLIPLAVVAAPRQPAEVRPPFRLRWRARVGERVDTYAIRGTLLAFATENHYGVLDLSNGGPLWRRRYDDGGTALAFAGDHLWIRLGSGELTVCDARTGAVNWSTLIAGFSAPLLVDRGVVYTEDQPGNLVAYDAATHRPRWERPLLPDPVLPEGARAEVGLSAVPVISGGGLIAATRAGELLSLEPRSGKIRWRSPLGGSPGAWVSGLAVDADTVYAAGTDGRLCAYELRSGRRRWRRSYPEAIVGAPVRVRDLLLFSARDGQLHALAARDGSSRWKRTLTTGLAPRVTPPLVVGEQIRVGAGSRLLVFTAAGKQAWSGGTGVGVFEAPLSALADGMLVPGARGMVRLEMDPPPALPASPAARRQLARKLAARFDRLTISERQTLRALRDDAAAALLPLLRSRLRGYLAAVATAGPVDTEEARRTGAAVENVLSTFAEVMRVSDVGPLIELAHAAERVPVFEYRWNARWRLLEVLSDEEQRHGEPGAVRVRPFMLEVAGKVPQDPAWAAGVRFLYRSHHPDAIRFMTAALQNDSADPQARRAAFLNLAEVGGATGVEAVLRETTRRENLPSLRNRMGMDLLRDRPEEGSTREVQPWEIRKDPAGRTWGLFTGPAFGSPRDLYLAEWEGARWSDPVFLAREAPGEERPSWPAGVEPDSTLRRDSDQDGWSDLAEQRLGTDPRKADTDGDGTPDPADANPLVKPRTLNEAEQVLAAAFSGRFRFAEERSGPCVVDLPEAMAPFELSGWGWVVLPGGRDYLLHRLNGEGGTAGVDFSPPSADFSGRTYYPRDRQQVILWNHDHTRAKVQVRAIFGSLDASGYDITLKRVGDRWLMIDLEEAWVS